ncbi:hypothetical protein V6N13_022764 [Hibiscus sabdariffa]
MVDRLPQGPFRNCMEWFDSVFPLFDPEEFSFLMVLLWNIWNRRNRWLHSNQLVPARLVSEYAQIVHGGFQQSNEDVVSQVACVRMKNWSKPEQGHIKINEDGAWKASTRTAAIGRTSNPPGMVGRRARKSMSGAANDSTTKFPISGKVPLEWLMHRLASPSPGHAQSVGVFVTPGRPTTRGFGLVDARSRWLCATCLDNVTPNTGSPCVATVQLGGVSRPSIVCASARPMSQWVCSLLGYFIVPSGCGVPSLIVSSAPRPNLSHVWVVDRWVWMLLLVRNGHVSVEMVVCVGRLRASRIELSSHTPLQCRPLVVVVPKGCDRDPVLRT